MRPPRIAILVLFFFTTLFLFCRSVLALVTRSTPNPPPAPAAAPAAEAPKRRYSSFFSFSSPLSLFPPNAIITLTDDNSTSFPARPAAFGPPFPNKGLSGQLWIGSGFADDLQEGEGEGELGCSDAPAGRVKGDTKRGGSATKSKSAAADGKAGNRRRDVLDAKDQPAETEPQEQAVDPKLDDGTDDYLAMGLGESAGVKSKVSETRADIQSIQEAAEISGKVVLLSRGGCGFSHKVMWAQRRGAIAVIVGDNQRGGPLIQMYAKGDTSNITIPSVFTSRTTAHILSSLMQPGSFVTDGIDENGHSAFKVQQSDKSPKGKKETSKAAAAEKAPAKTTTSTKKAAAAGKKAAEKEPRPNDGSSWFKRFFTWGSGSPGSDATESTRDKLDWVLVEDWNDEKDKAIQSSMDKAKRRGSASASRGSANDFVIGVQDWRDRDLVSPPLGHAEAASGKLGNAVNSGSTSDSSASKGGKPSNDLQGGSVTPGSGESSGKQGSGSSGFTSHLFREEESKESTPEGAAKKTPALPEEPVAGPNPGGATHEGLWVTITPSSSASPFLDTLLVLVVSPLITLTVVYALLILRARIRRRRWRAPKSVVDRLPVRTYHTVATSGTTSPRLPSPTSSSPTTPLLQSTGPSRPRPRSRTTTGVPDPNDRLWPDSGIPASRSPSRTRTRHETKNAVSSEWKKYMGRQVECVVCLEEYVDGVSRVMSLPCGHEFHVECITPWLTTRRRTCPICKGDVVRSLARGMPSSPRYEPYRDDSDDDEEEQESGPSTEESGSRDLETGVLAQSPPRPTPNRWLSWMSSLTERATGRSRREQEGRDR